MKKTKPKTKPVKTLAAKPAEVEQPCGLPTTAELAQLAASLAKRQDDSALISKVTAGMLANDALRIWNAANQIRNFEIRRRNAALNRPERATPWVMFPNYPLTLDEFLRWILPGHRRGDREAAWRHYNLQKAGKTHQTATAAEVTAASTEWTSPQNDEEFMFVHTSFEAWWVPYHNAQISAERSKAAKSKKR